MNWYDLLTYDEWLYQCVEWPTVVTPPPTCPHCGAVMAYFYGWYCPMRYFDIGDCPAQPGAVATGEALVQ